MPTANDLWAWILDKAEEIDGCLVCRASIWRYLGKCGVEAGAGRQHLRTRLVKELTAAGKVERRHPQSRWLFILDPPS